MPWTARDDRDRQSEPTMTTPRYIPDREFPPYSFLPGRFPHPTSDPKGHSYGIAGPRAEPLTGSWRDNREYLWGADLYNHGYPWEAHEAWEGVWKLAVRGAVEHRFLQGLIQCAAAVVKDRCNQLNGVASLSSGAKRYLDSVINERGPVCYGLDIAGFIGEFTRCAQARAKRRFWNRRMPPWPPVILATTEITQPHLQDE